MLMPHSKEERRFKLKYPINNNQVIQDLEQSETYKYLGMEEGEGLQHPQMKGKIQKEYKRRVKLVLKSELNARNKIT